MPGSPMRVTGLAEFAAGIRELERTLPAELDAEVTAVAETLLPAIKANTPVGDGRGGTPGRLRDATHVGVVRGRPGILNSRPYANAIHWGRKEWPKMGASNSRPSVIEGRRFAYDTVKEKMDVIEVELARRMNLLLERLLP